MQETVANAIERAPCGSAVTAAIRRAPDGVAIAIADRGAALPEREREHAFDPRGGALALHLAKLVAAAHGGSIAARAREGGGAVFELLLPSSAAVSGA